MNLNIRAIKQPWKMSDVVGVSGISEFTSTFSKRLCAFLEEKARGTPFQSTVAYTKYINVSEMGSWVQQSDWNDKTGFYVTIELHSLYRDNQWIKEAQSEAFRIFMDTILDVYKGFGKDHGSLLADVDEFGTKTYYVMTGIHEISD